MRLGDLLSVDHGYAFKSKYFVDHSAEAPVVVAVGNFDYGGGFRFDSTQRKGYDSEYPARFELSPGDMLVVMTCQTQGGEILGVPGRIPDDGRLYLHNQRLGRVRIHSDALDDRFAYWTFLSPTFNRELCRTATGSKILHTAPSRIEAYQLHLPPITKQRAIARVLDALENKIQSSNCSGRGTVAAGV